MSAIPPPVVPVSPPPIVSPLGVDPPASVAPAPAPVVPPAAPAPQMKQMTQAEYDDLQRKASGFETIQNDPVLAPKVLDHYRAKTGSIGQPVVPPVQPSPNQQPNAELEAMRKTLAETNRRLAQQEVTSFFDKHADAKDLKDDMAKLINSYGMSLEDAYRFSKAASSQPNQKPGVGAVAHPTTETNKTATIPNPSETDISDLQKKIDDPNATRKLDDAFALAWEAAKKINASKPGE